MNISVKGEYALQAIFDLAANAAPNRLKSPKSPAGKRFRRSFSN